MAFTRRHYREIAGRIETARSSAAIEDGEQIGDGDYVIAYLVDGLCETFAADNPLFDEAKFREACGE